MNEIRQFLEQSVEELAKLEGEIIKLQAERDKLVWMIGRLEYRLKEISSGQVSSDQLSLEESDLQVPKRRYTVIELARKVLENEPKGLTLPAMLAEFRKLGWQSESVNAANTVNSILHRKGTPFERIDGRWKLFYLTPEKQNERLQGMRAMLDTLLVKGHQEPEAAQQVTSETLHHGN